MTQIDWSKAPPHATHWCHGNSRIKAGWIYNIGGEFYSCYAETGLEHLPEFPVWREDRLIQRPPKHPWAGEGLPQVGAVCEIKQSRDWTKVEVVAIHNGCAVIAIPCGDSMFEYDQRDASELRPIRTPKQLAAEERETGIKSIMDDYVYTVGPCTHRLATSQAERIYDAGYRKQVKP